MGQAAVWQGGGLGNMHFTAYAQIEVHHLREGGAGEFKFSPETFSPVSKSKDQLFTKLISG